jgi:heat shock protein HslJ
MRRFFLLLAVFAVIGGCATEVVDVSDQPMSDERRALAGHRFESVSIVVDGQAVELGQFRGEGAHLEIGFGLSHIYASGGCNDLTSGAWEVVDGRLVTGPDWSTTLRRCGRRASSGSLAGRLPELVA